MKKRFTGLTAVSISAAAIIFISGAAIMAGTGILGSMMAMAEDIEMESKASVESQNTEKSGGEEAGYDLSDWHDGKITVYDINASRKEGELTYTEALCKAAAYAKNLKDVDVSEADAEIAVLVEDEVTQCPRYGQTTYSIRFNLEEKTKPLIMVNINAVTGDIFGFRITKVSSVKGTEYIPNGIMMDGYEERRAGYPDYEGLSDNEVAIHFQQKLNNEKKNYENIAMEFIETNLNLGKVSESYGYYTGSYKSQDGAGDRYSMKLFCNTSNGDIVEISVDQLSKEVIGYLINPPFVNVK